MNVVHLTLSIEEADALHSLFVARRHAFARFCLQDFHSSSTIQQYIHELKALEAKLMQVPLAEYLALGEVENKEEVTDEG